MPKYDMHVEIDLPTERLFPAEEASIKEAVQEAAQEAAMAWLNTVTFKLVRGEEAEKLVFGPAVEGR